MTHSEQLQKDREIARLRERCALLESLLGEGIRGGYFDPSKCSASWLTPLSIARVGSHLQSNRRLFL
jgi:hypothetical protein